MILTKKEANTPLLPCPFCGSPAKLLQDLYGGDNGDMSGVCCTTCEGGVTGYNRGNTTMMYYIVQWNTRKEPN